MELNNIIPLFILILISYYTNKYFLIICKKYKFNLLIDNQFKKPQAFHENSTQRIGGVTFFLLLNLSFLYLYLVKNIYLIEYLSFCTFFFILGLLDDLKINIAPKFRLLAMILFLIILILFNKFYIEKTGLGFLNNLLEIDIFTLTFTCLCFLFIINGSNLVDGFNGLLGIHALIIFIILFFINLLNGNNNLMIILFCIISITLIFVKFNFPKAQIFLGDSGAYLIGSLIAVSVIKTSVLTPTVHPFFFCILLFYLFFEVFFSFFRKIIFTKQSPLLPDRKHLHMSLYKLLFKKNKSKFISNYSVSIYINLIYIALITPGVLFMKDGLFCRFYFFSLLILYIFFYRIIYKIVK